MAETYKPSALLSRAIGLIEAQCDGSKLPDWNSKHALACVRYLIAEACADAKAPLNAEQVAAIKAAVNEAGPALVEQANMKKKLQSIKLVPDKVAIKEEFE